MLNYFRTFIFILGLAIIGLALYLVHGDGGYSREFIFSSISIIVMYFMVFGPFTFFSLLPKTENVEKAIATYTASWIAVTAYCSASIMLLIGMIVRNVILGWFMDLPSDWINNILDKDNAIIQQATYYSDLTFHIIVIIQLILFFIFMIKIFLGGLIAHQIGAVKKQEKEEVSKILQLRSESQLLEIESLHNESIPTELKRTITQIKNNLRYLSPANTEDAFNYEVQMLDSIAALRSKCKQSTTSPEEIQTLLNSFESLYQTRKLIYKN